MDDLTYNRTVNLMKSGPEGLFIAYQALKQAAEEDNTDAQIQLGMIFEGLACAHLGEPISLMNNFQLAYQWYKKAADCNSHEGFYHCGRIQYLGRIGDAEKKNSSASWNKAVELGSRKAAFCLAKLYLRGEFVEQDIKRAFILCSFSKDLPESERLLNQIISSRLLDLNSLSYLYGASEKFIQKHAELTTNAKPKRTATSSESAVINEWEVIVEKLSGF